MKLEESVEGRLAEDEEVPEEERQRSGEGEKHDDEHVGDRGREIARQLAPADRPDIAQGIRGARRGWRPARRRGQGRRVPAVSVGRQAAKHLVQESPAWPESLDRPCAFPSRRRDRRQDLPAARGNDGQLLHRAVAIARLHRRNARQRLQLGTNWRGPLARQRKRHGIEQPRLALEVLGGAVRDDSPFGDDQGTAADRLHFLEDMGRDDDGLVPGHPPDERSDLELLVGVQPVGRLVEDEHVRIVQQGLSEADTALEPLGERLDRLVQDGSDAGPLDDVPDCPPAHRSEQPANVGDEPEVGGGRDVAVGRRTLRQVAEAALRGDGVDGDVDAADLDASGTRGKEPRDHPHRGRLAGAVRSENTEHLAPVHGERDTVHGEKVAEPPAQALDGDHRGHGVLPLVADDMQRHVARAARRSVRVCRSGAPAVSSAQAAEGRSISRAGA